MPESTNYTGLKTKDFYVHGINLYRVPYSGDNGNIACSRGKHWNVPTGLSVIDSTAKQETRIQSSLSD